MIRKPIVAGQFYPADPDELAADISRYLVAEAEPASALAVVAPHAAYMYSGIVAGAVYSRVEVPERVIVLGVNHQGYGANAAVMTEGAWAMPFGQVPVDTALARAVLEASDTMEEDSRAHQYEHSLEVQLPFLQHFQPGLRVVPVVLSRADSRVCSDVGEACAGAVRQAGGPVLLVASTDLSHEQNDYERLKTNDRRVIERILELDPEGLLREVAEHGVTMCGYGPTASALVAANALGASQAVLVGYSDSYAVTRSTDYVVGYAGIVVS